MPTGTVKWFNNAKGFGFILPEDGGDDLFAHYSAIEMGGYRTLKAGQVVSFDVEKGEKGMHASHIKPVSDEDGSDSAVPELPKEVDADSALENNTEEMEELQH